MIRHVLDNPDDLGESLLKKISVFSIKYPYKLLLPSKYCWTMFKNDRANTVAKIVRDIKISKLFSLLEKNSFIKIIVKIIAMLLIIKEIFSVELGVKKRPGVCDIK